MSDEGHLALFCDFENIALGVRDAKYAKFDIQPVLERLLLRGSIVTKKAYCDWERYKDFKRLMHEAAFEMIDIPHVRQAGKNSADIRMVVDALDLCYTKEHIDTFVIISGDSDFSPLVSKLRENAKTVIGVGVKNSTSDLLMSNCDEFIFYDDLVRAEEARKSQPAKRSRTGNKAKKPESGGKPVPSGKPAAASSATKDKDALLQEGIDLVLGTIEALQADKSDGALLWGSVVKQTLKRRQPGFNESYYGYRSFSDLLEEAEDRGYLDLELDDKSGGYVIRKLLSGD